MKKIFKLLIAFTLLFTINVHAESIESIKMDIYVDSNGDGHVTETWVATPTEKTEYYHAYHNIGNSEITDFEVRDESSKYTFKEWDIDDSFGEKAYKYGYNYTNNGVELCFGKSKYKKNTYTLTYTIKSFVSRTDDADIIYWNLLDSISPAPGNVEIVIYADEPFSDNLDVWGYGNYGGLAYVYDGKIYLSNEDLDSDEYMVALVKFPLNTFNTTNVLENDFDHYYEMAEDGATHYSDDSNIILVIFGLLFNLFVWGAIFAGILGAIATSGPKSGKSTLSFGEKGKKLPKDVNMFRDIPCNKDIYRAYWIAHNYGLMKKQTDLLGAILLKWLKDKKVTIKSETVGGLFKKEETVIIFESNSEFENDLEQQLFEYMYQASKDGILESKEFERWCNTNYSKILKWFDKVLDFENEKLKEEGKLVEKVETRFKVFKTKVLEVDPSMYEEAVKMKGLKEFFNEFENMKDKEAIEVMLWEYYLMYAQIFGVAEKVAKQFKKLYPDVITDYSYDSVIFVHHISHSGMNKATTARDRAQSYSAGGGGFSSGGGGFGSFGGGGGGSR